MVDRLTEGQQLVRGGSLVSNNGAFTFTLQDDGNLVLSAGGEARWATATNGQDVVRAQMQPDGNFVAYTADKPVWHTDTRGKKNVRLVLQDDGNLVLYSADGVAWASNTAGDVPPPPAAEPAPEPTPEAAPDSGSEAAAAPVSEEPPEAAPEPAPEPPAAPSYTVEAGDTLWGIAERFYGDGSKYQAIADASSIENPDLIYPGQVLTIP
jgi:nucleoid-associated protein YgaU